MEQPNSALSVGDTHLRQGFGGLSRQWRDKKKFFIILGVLIAALLVLGGIAAIGSAVFVARSDHAVIRQISGRLPIPAARLGQKTILYRDFLAERDTVKFFLNSEAAKEQGVDTAFDVSTEKNLLEKMLQDAALEELAEQKNITVTEEELRSFFAEVVLTAASTTADIGSYLLKNFGWSEEDFRQQVLRLDILGQRLAAELAKDKPDDPNALAAYLSERLQREDVVRYLRF
jgi:hypothetical protein